MKTFGACMAVKRDGKRNLYLKPVPRSQNQKSYNYGGSIHLRSSATADSTLAGAYSTQVQSSKRKERSLAMACVTELPARGMKLKV
ncbi:hypothetical protein GQ457_09G013750 [Hibiscus cannabinus]